MEAPSVPSSSSPPTPTSSAAEQARLRKERREAKIRAGGSARLSKITSMSGRAAEPAPTPSTDALPSTTAPSLPDTTSAPGHATAHDDPEEVDISTHAPASSRRGNDPREDIDEATLRSMMLDFQRQTQDSPFARGPGTGPDTAMPMQGPGEDDPIMQMMQQMLGTGGMPGLPGMPGGNDSLPPGIASMLGQGNAQPDAVDNYSYLWRLVHALFALILAVYAASSTAFNGSKISRTLSVAGDKARLARTEFFWIFATCELVLQSSRFLLERGRTPKGGLLMGLARFLPQPYSGYLAVLSRYSVIYTTVTTDAFVVVFALGVVAWWRGQV